MNRPIKVKAFVTIKTCTTCGGQLINGECQEFLEAVSRVNSPFAQEFGAVDHETIANHSSE